MSRFDLNSWKESPESPLHLIFLLHLLFGSWSLFGFWSGNSLILQNVFFLGCLLWCLQEKRSSTPVLLALAIDVMSILMDILVLSCHWPVHSRGFEIFSGLMAIVNLVLRFASSYVLYRSLGVRDNLDGSAGSPYGYNAAVDHPQPHAASAAHQPHPQQYQQSSVPNTGFLGAPLPPYSGAAGAAGTTGAEAALEAYQPPADPTGTSQGHYGGSYQNAHQADLNKEKPPIFD